MRLNSRDEALLALVEARTLFEATEDSRGMWLVRAGEAHCARKAGHTDEAINVLRALAADPPVEATAADLFIVHLGLAVAYRFVGLLEPALKWHYQAVDTARDSGAPVLLAMMLSNLGGYHCDLHNPEEGCRMLEQGLELTRICDAGRLTSPPRAQSRAVLCGTRPQRRITDHRGTLFNRRSLCGRGRRARLEFALGAGARLCA
ncbi:MAG: hypothetical protein ACR2GP_12135 [Burkholderiaceae bacterium]